MNTPTTLPQDAEREQWLAARRTGIGGSDAAVALGLSPYKTPYQLYLEKRGERTEEVALPERVRWGTKLEAAIAEEYAERTGRTVHRVNVMQRHPQFPFMLANLDRRVVGARIGVECKNVDKDAHRFNDEWGAAGTDEVPTTYMLQVQHYLAVTGWEAWDLAALIGGNELRIYSIRRDDELIADLIEGEQAFWNHVSSGTPPPITTVEEAKQRFPASAASLVEATAEIHDACVRLGELKQDVKDREAEIDSLQARILAHIGENDTLTYLGRVIATWKSSRPGEKLDHKALQEAHPDLCAEFMREYPGARRFLLKGVA